MSKLCRLIAVFLSGALFGMSAGVAAPAPFALLHSFFGPGTNVQTGAQHGRSVALDGNIGVVGAAYDDVGAADSGVVKVYDVTTGALRHTLTNPSPAVGDVFGFSVAISGTRVVVGAPHDDAGAQKAGSAYVYDLSGVAPLAPVIVLTNPTPAEHDLFGVSVAISGVRIVVGSRYADNGATNAGGAYVYDLASAIPTRPVATLNNPTPVSLENFGDAVAIAGTRVVVGALGDRAGAPFSGSAYVYALASATPTVPAITLTNPSPAEGDVFGHRLAIAGTRVVVGAIFDNTGATDAGSVYVYDLANATPTVPVLSLTNPAPAIGDGFGSSVAISGTRMVVGVFRGDAGTLDAGSAYLYDLASAMPIVPLATLTNPSPAVNDYFGDALAINGAIVMVGAWGDDTNAEDCGAAYVFGITPTLNIVPAAPSFATISWTPATSSGFVLQCADSLALANWVNAPSGALNPVAISTTNAARFYRLFQP